MAELNDPKQKYIQRRRELFDKEYSNLILEGSGWHQQIHKLICYGLEAEMPQFEIISKLRNKYPVHRHAEIDNSFAAIKAKDSYEKYDPYYKGKDYEPLRSAANAPFTSESTFHDFIPKTSKGFYSIDYFQDKLSPVKLTDLQPVEQAKLYLETLFDNDEYCFLGKEGETGSKHIKKVSEHIKSIVFQKTVPFSHAITQPFSGGSWQGKGWATRCNEDVSIIRTMIVEHDGETRQNQLDFWGTAIDKGWPVIALVDSAGKSIHAVLAVKITDLAEWDRVIKNSIYLKFLTPAGFDDACKTVSRLTRLPGHMRCDKKVTTPTLQRLLYLNPGAVGKNSIPIIKKTLTAANSFKWDREKLPWEQITDEMISQAIAGTPFGNMVHCQLKLGKNNSYPFRCAFAKALICAGLLMINRKERSEDRKIPFGARGGDFYIDLGQGLVTQMNVLLNLPSGRGKDVGQIDTAFARKISKDAGSGGSLEGVIDALISNDGVGLIKISEIKEYLLTGKGESYKNKIKGLILEGWQKGFIDERLSQATKEKRARFSSFFYPVVLSGTQPEVLRKVVTPEDINSGLLNRFLFFYLNDKKRFYQARVSSWQIVNEMYEYSIGYRKAFGTYTPPEDYNVKLFSLFDKYPSEESFMGYQARLVSEYLPLIFVIIAMDKNGQIHDTEGNWQITQMIVLWLYNQAKLSLQDVEYSEEQLERKKLRIRIFELVKKSPGCRKAYISHNTSRFSRKDRDEAIADLCERGVIGLDETAFTVLDESMMC